MAAYPDILRRHLDAAINYVVENKSKYVENSNTDFTRTRKLSLSAVVALLISMTGGSLNKELLEFCKNNETTVSASALVQSRAKISPKAFEAVFRRFNRLCNDKKTLRGYHIFALDGTCVNRSRDPNAPSFVRNDSNPRGYNQMHLNAWYDLENNVYFDALIQPQPRADERSAALSMIQRNEFHGHNVLLLDRGYEAYSLLSAIIEKPNLDFVCRVRQDKSCMKAIQGLPMERLDRDIAVTITTSQSREHKELGYVFVQTHKDKNKRYSSKTRNASWTLPSPYTLKFRAVRFMLPSGEYETVATSLPRNRFSIDDISDLYHQRWGIETSFRSLKYAIGLINLHGKSDGFVFQEVYSALTAYNFANRAASAAVIKQKESNIYEYKVNFTMTVALVKSFLRDRREDGEMLIQAIGRYVVPVRPGRMDKRKLRPKGFVGFTYRIAA